MPHMSGIEVLESLRASGDKVPVILISGAEWPIAREGLVQSSANAFLAKPFSVQELLGKIEFLLQAPSEGDALRNNPPAK